MIINNIDLRLNKPNANRVPERILKLREIFRNARTLEEKKQAAAKLSSMAQDEPA